jgi:hypothetical protein
VEKPNYNINPEVPKHTLEDLLNYFRDGTPPGSFVQAVLENDFIEAFKRADSENLRAMFSIAEWMYNNAPSRDYGTWGSPEAVERHITECAAERTKQGG